MGTKIRSGRRRGYFDVTRTFTYGVLFALPLLIIYEIGITIINQTYPVRNGADVIIRALLFSYGDISFYAFSALMIGGLAIQWQRERKRYHLELRKVYFAGMLAESLVYATLLGAVSSTLTRALLPGLSISLQSPPPLALQGLGTQLILSIGAGIYEEFVFRVLLVSGFFLVLRRLGGARPVWLDYGLAAVAAAFLFSAFHYVGAYGDTFHVVSFTFRFMAGLVLNALYITRGFGIAVWAHALYDVMLALADG